MANNPTSADDPQGTQSASDCCYFYVYTPCVKAAASQLSQCLQRAKNFEDKCNATCKLTCALAGNPKGCVAACELLLCQPAVQAAHFGCITRYLGTRELCGAAQSECEGFPELFPEAYECMTGSGQLLY